MKFVHATGARPLLGYTIKRGVGIGGFGEVYFATSDAGKEVALKRIQRNLDVEVRGVTQCLNLKHPNLISIYDIKYDDLGEGWIVMEFVAGESLKDVIERHPHGMPAGEVRFWFTGTAAGVAYLHDHGIVHRDLKPGNIFRDEGVVKIGDYGLSKFISCSRRSGQTESVGTFHYMAPEIGKGVYGKEIDIYALGIILCEMLTGHVPFDGETSQEIIMKHLTADPDLSRVPSRFRPVLERALVKDPVQRFRSVAEMLRAMPGDCRPPEASDPHLSPFSAPPPRSPESVAAGLQEPLDIGEEAIIRDAVGPIPVAEVLAADVVKPPVIPGAATREPIAAAVVAAWAQLAHGWKTAQMSAPIKVLLMVAAIVLLAFNSGWLVPVTFFLGMVYLVYFAIRAMVVSSHASQVRHPPRMASPCAPPPRHSLRESYSARVGRASWRQQARESLARKPGGQRLSELTGSWLMAALVCGVLSLILLLAGGKKLDASVETWAFYAWLMVTSVAASWLILGFAKIWEGCEGEEVLRRFGMMVGGLLIGVVAFAVGEMLMVRLSTGEMFNVLELPRDMIPHGMYAANGVPNLTAFLAYFATLFVVLRWWRQVDPLRRTRFSLFATVASVLVAAVIPWQIPWGFLLAANISISIQLSAPWLNSADRTRLRHELHHV